MSKQQVSKAETEFDNGHVIQHALYDTIDISELSSRALRFFRKCVGERLEGQYISAAETNLTLPGYLPRGQTFQVQSIRVIGLPVELRDKVTAVLHIGPKYYEHNLVEILDGYTFPIPRWIDSLWDFCVELHPTQEIGPFRIRVELHGLLHRPSH